MTSGSPSRRRICGGRWRGYDWTVSSDISAVFRMKFYVFRKFYYLCTSIPAQSDIRRPGTYTGEMLEWLKRHAWKACIRQNRISGSNPDLSAPIGRSLLRPVLVSCLLKVYFHKGSRIQNHNVRRTSAYWSKGHPGEGRWEEACAAWLIPISPQPTLKLKDLQNYHPALRPRMQSRVFCITSCSVKGFCHHRRSRRRSEGSGALYRSQPRLSEPDSSLL